eukprot:COSAG01_NODE_7401_length_3221_cov_2.139334_2_plen_82_part_00
MSEYEEARARRIALNEAKLCELELVGGHWRSHALQPARDATKAAAPTQGSGSGGRGRAPPRAYPGGAHGALSAPPARPARR